MGCLTKTLGRLLFVTIIVSSAYLHLSKPENYTEDLSSNYATLFKLVNQHVAPGVIPPAEVINWTLWSKILGLFEGLIAILIVFGDCWGGFFLFVNLLVSGAFDYKDICSIIQWDATRQLEVLDLDNKVLTIRIFLGRIDRFDGMLKEVLPNRLQCQVRSRKQIRKQMREDYWRKDIL